MTHRQQPLDDHAAHDRLLVVRYLDRDDELSSDDTRAAEAQLSACAECAALGAELELVSRAVRTTPTPARSRDFRLTPTQAADLRSGGFRGFMQRLGGVFRIDVVRPLAGAAIAIGLLLAVAGSLPMLKATSAAGVGDTSLNAAIPTAGPAGGLAPNGDPSAQGETSSSRGPNYGQAPALAQGSAAASDASKAGPDPLPGGAEASLAPQALATLGVADATATADSTITAFVPHATPVNGAPPAANGVPPSGALNATAEPISPILILGILLAAIGSLVLVLTVLSRRTRSESL